MSSIENQAYNLAREVLRHSYSPYSEFKVGAALVTDDNLIFTGTNVENSSYGLTICAERSAAVKAVSEGARKFKMLVITGESEKFIFPCGACLQFLSEFCEDLIIISINSAGQKQETTLAELLPRGFKI